MPARVRTPPYGPVRGMMQGIDLMRRTSPALVDESLLTQQKIAPGNEYKVIGALKFLGLIDDDGQPTESARLFKTKGAAFTLNLQNMIRQAYAELFERIDVRRASRDDLHNFFLTEAGLGAEMATKATRVLLELCRLAELPVATVRPAATSAVSRLHSTGSPAPSGHGAAQSPVSAIAGFGWPIVVGLTPSLVLALTPETARLSEEELTELLRKVQRAVRRAAADAP